MHSHDSFSPSAHLLLLILATLVAAPRGHAQYGASNQDTVYSLPGGLIMDVVIGDFTNDGRLDIATLDTIHGVRVFEFDGIRWVPVASNNPPYNKGQTLARADFNRDGNQDLFVGRVGPNAILHGDGHGNFVDQTPPAFANYSDATVDSVVLEPALTEAPSDLFLFIGNNGTTNQWMYFDSQGQLQAVLLFPGPLGGLTTALVLMHLPNLGYSLIHATQAGQTNLLFRFRKNAILAEAPGGALTDVTQQMLPPDTDISTGAAWVGPGSNGVPDLVVTNNGAPNRHLVFDGTGFNEMSPPLGAPTGPTQAVVTGDWDQDGLTDIATFDTLQRPAFYFNSGTTLDPRTLIASTVNNPREALSVDIDGDGDTDIVIVDSEKVSVLKSRINELAISATTKIGKTASFTIYAERSSETQNAYVFASLGLSPNPVHLPFGRVDVASDAVLALLVSIARFSTRGTGTIDVPMDPNIVGLEVLFQAAIATVTFGNIRISNVDGTEIVPGG